MNQVVARVRNERGSIAPLAIGLSALTFTVLLVSLCAGSMFVLERRLMSLAEFAALSRAESGMSAEEFIQAGQPDGFRNLEVANDSRADGITYEVVLCSSWSAPLPSIVGLEDRKVCAKGLARSG